MVLATATTNMFRFVWIIFPRMATVRTVATTPWSAPKYDVIVDTGMTSSTTLFTSVRSERRTCVTSVSRMSLQNWEDDDETKVPKHEHESFDQVIDLL